MKAKSLIFLGIFVMTCLFFSTKTQAQDNKENVVTISLTNLAIVTPTIYYERVLNEKMSAKLGLYYTAFKVSGTKMSGLGVIPEFRFYPGQKGAPNGFYLAPFLKYQNYALSVDEAGIEEKASLSGIGGGLCIGAQFGKTVVFDMFMGPSFSSWSTKYEGTATEDDFTLKLGGSGVGLRFGMSIGFGF